jgi:hypothetical protein
MKSSSVVEFIREYEKTGGDIKTPGFRQGETQLKPEWANIAHALDHLCNKVKKGERPRAGTLCKTCAEYEKCDMRDASEFCAAYKKKEQ